MSGENVEIVRSRFQRFIATGDLSEDWYTDDFVWDMSTFRGWPEKQQYYGLAGVREFLSGWVEAWDDWRMELNAVYGAEDGRVVTIARQFGKSKSSGLDATMDFAQIWTLEEGRYARMQMYANPDEALEAAGLSEQVMSEENVEIVRRSVQAFNEGGLAAIAKFAHPDIEFQEPPTQPAPRTARGQEAVTETWGSFDAAWEEHRSELKEVRELSEDEVLLSSVEHFRGRDGMEISAPCWTIYTFRDGKIIKFRPFWDHAQALEAAGLSGQAMSEENVEIVQRMNEALNGGNPEVAVPLLDPNVEWEENNPVWPGLDSVYRGHPGVARWLKEAVFEPWQRLESEVLDYTDLGDHVLMLSHLRGRGRGSGIEVDMPIYNLFTVRDGKIVRRRIYQDRGEALEAAGLPE